LTPRAVVRRIRHAGEHRWRAARGLHRSPAASGRRSLARCHLPRESPPHDSESHVARPIPVGPKLGELAGKRDSRETQDSYDDVYQSMRAWLTSVAWHLALLLLLGLLAAGAGGRGGGGAGDVEASFSGSDGTSDGLDAAESMTTAPTDV